MIHHIVYQEYQPTTDVGKLLWSVPDVIYAGVGHFLTFLAWLYALTPAEWSPAQRALIYPAAWFAFYVAAYPIRRRRKASAPLGKAVFAGLFNVLRDGLLRPGGRFLGRYPLLLGLVGVKLHMHGEGHSLTIAPPRSGKTAGGVIPTLFSYRRGSVIVTDIKGEIAAVTKRFRSTVGRVVVINPWRDELMTDPAFGLDLGDDGFNPLQLVGPDEEGRSAAALISSLILFDAKQGFDYFSGEGREALELAMLFLAMVMPEKLTLAGLRSFLYDQTGFVGALKAIMASDKQGPGWAALREGASKLLPIALNAPQQFAGIIGTATTALKIYNADTRLGQHTARNGFNLKDLKGKEKLTVYVVCPPSHLVSDDRRWLNLILALIMQQVGKPGASRETVMLMDEAPALGFVPSLLPAMEQFAGAGLRVNLYAQSPGQFVNIYGQDGLARLWGVCETKQFFRFTDHAQAAQVSEWMGQITMESVSVNERGDRNVSSVGVPLLRPEELTQMKRDRQIIFRPGLPPIRARVYPYFKDAAWRTLADPNPYRSKKRRPAARPVGKAGEEGLR